MLRFAPNPLALRVIVCVLMMIKLKFCVDKMSVWLEAAQCSRPADSIGYASPGRNWATIKPNANG